MVNTEQDPERTSNFGSALKRFRLDRKLSHQQLVLELAEAGLRRSPDSAEPLLSAAWLNDFERGRRWPSSDTFVSYYPYLVHVFGRSVADELEQALETDLDQWAREPDDDVLSAITVERVKDGDDPALEEVVALLESRLPPDEVDSVETFQEEVEAGRRWVLVAKADVIADPERQPPIPGGRPAVVGVLDFLYEPEVHKQVVIWYMACYDMPTIVAPDGTRGEVRYGGTTSLLMSEAEYLLNTEDALQEYEGIAAEISISLQAIETNEADEHRKRKLARFCGHGANYGFPGMEQVAIDYLGPASLETPVWEDENRRDPKGTPMLLAYAPRLGHERLSGEAVRQCIYDFYRTGYTDDPDFLDYLDRLQAKAESLDLP